MNTQELIVMMTRYSDGETDRYFPATILGGHFHVRGIPDWGPWGSHTV